MKQLSITSFLVPLLLFGCTTAQINQTIGAVSGEQPLTRAEVAAGLKAALEKGTFEGTDLASQIDGYYKNPQIKIPFPPEAQKVEQKLRQIGLGSEVDRFVLTLNRAAEKAADEAKPIFLSAIRSMTIDDAWGILKGDDHAATEYLKRTTSDQLRAKFQPIISNALNQTNATKYYVDLINAYNKIPFVEHMNPNLDEYATEEAIEGLFYLIAQEEEKIRENPAARTTELLRKVFGAQD
ncbi:MAG: DUF4197 domain-containing protein [Candidatus Cyclobacteriaceae bacterium M2_1C_046]